MAQQQINVGTSANDETGDALRDAFIKSNANATDVTSIDNRVTSLEDSGFITDGDNVIRIFEKADLPTPVGGIITVPETDIRQVLYANIDLGSDRIVYQGDNVQIYGASPNVGFTSTTAGALITTDKTLALQNMNLIALSASSLISGTDSASHALTLDSMGLVGGPATDLVVVDDYENLVIRLVGFYSGNNGLILGNNITNLSINLCQFEVGVTGVNIDLNGCLSEAVSIHNCVSVLSATSTFLVASPDSGNITASGGGTISENKIDDSAVGSVLSTGLSPLDLRWLSIGNNNINGSDRTNPTGWGFYIDGDTVTQTVPAGEGNAIRLSIDGLGANSNSDYLPRVIRGVSELWDTSTNEMIPITLGDSFNVRISFTLTAKGANPSIMTVVFDIGGTAGITIPVYSLSLTTPNAFPRTVTMTTGVFALDTFLANNGQIFLYTDSGTIDIEARSILIQRISSGAS